VSVSTFSLSLRQLCDGEMQMQLERRQVQYSTVQYSILSTVAALARTVKGMEWNGMELRNSSSNHQISSVIVIVIVND